MVEPATAESHRPLWLKRGSRGCPCPGVNIQIPSVVINESQNLRPILFRLFSHVFEFAVFRYAAAVFFVAVTASTVAVAVVIAAVLRIPWWEGSSPRGSRQAARCRL
jgi:hypothetical protein